MIPRSPSFTAFSIAGFSLLLAPPFQEAQQTGASWWVILLILAVVIFLVWWLINQNVSDESPNIPHEEHHEHEERAAVAQIEHVPAADDLELIEGIGPKIAGLLRAEGITTFAQLAGASTADVQRILNEAKLSFTNPASWPEQARLAAAGDWEGFYALQSRLKAGRMVEP